MRTKTAVALSLGALGSSLLTLKQLDQQPFVPNNSPLNLLLGYAVGCYLVFLVLRHCCCTRQTRVWKGLTPCVILQTILCLLSAALDLVVSPMLLGLVILINQAQVFYFGFLK